jgi:hypothetical protein
MSNNYFSFDKAECEYLFHETKEEAKKEAEKALDRHKDNASEYGWTSEDMTDEIGWGAVKESLKETSRKEKSDYTGEEWEEMCSNSLFETMIDYDLKEVNNA